VSGATVEWLAARGEPAPLVVDSPHSGRDYPADFAFRPPLAEMRRIEDALVDELLAGVPERGVALVRARFPRSYIDVNRAEDDIDPALLAEPWPGHARPGPKSESGVGLITAYQAGGAVYDRRLEVAEVERRIARCYRPYHACLARALDQVQGRFGWVWLLDMHSMPSRLGEVPVGLDFCLGDLDGASCAPELRERVRGWLAARGYRVGVNDPYRGAEIVRRHGDPRRGRHALQIEINRALYLDEQRVEPGPGFAALRAELTELIATLAEHSRERAAE